MLLIYLTRVCYKAYPLLDSHLNFRRNTFVSPSSEFRGRGNPLSRPEKLANARDRAPVAARLWSVGPIDSEQNFDRTVR